MGQGQQQILAAVERCSGLGWGTWESGRYMKLASARSAWGQHAIVKDRKESSLESPFLSNQSKRSFPKNAEED